jgi:hypothetical protein
MMRGNVWLLAGGTLSAAAALLHLAVIAGGPDWYRFFGAGEGLAQAAERGSPVPAFWCVGIATVLAVWAAYAFAGAGLLPRLPLMRTALVLISAVYLARGLLLVPALIAWSRGKTALGEHTIAFMIWSSLIVLAYGAAYAVGTWKAWPALSARGLSTA